MCKLLLYYIWLSICMVFQACMFINPHTTFHCLPGVANNSNWLSLSFTDESYSLRELPEHGTQFQFVIFFWANKLEVQPTGVWNKTGAWPDWPQKPALTIYCPYHANVVPVLALCLRSSGSEPVFIFSPRFVHTAQSPTGAAAAASWRHRLRRRFSQQQQWGTALGRWLCCF